MPPWPPSVRAPDLTAAHARRARTRGRSPARFHGALDKLTGCSRCSLPRRTTPSIGAAAATPCSPAAAASTARRGSGELKKQIQMVAEGSVLYADGVPLGAAADVAPDGFAHPVFRAGFALAIPLPEVH